MLSETVAPETRLDPNDILRAQREADRHYRRAGMAGSAAEAPCDPVQRQPSRYISRIETKSEWFIG